jgi:hypothetical protein
MANPLETSRAQDEQDSQARNAISPRTHVNLEADGEKSFAASPIHRSDAVE